MRNVKNYLFQNRVIIPLLLLSMLSLPPWTIYKGPDLPSLLRSVTLTKNLYPQTTVTDTDHQASDYWWDGTVPQHSGQRQETFLSIAALPPPLVSSVPTLISHQKLSLFTPTADHLTLKLLQNSIPPPSPQNETSLRPYYTHSPFPGSTSHIFISPHHTSSLILYHPSPRN